MTSDDRYLVHQIHPLKLLTDFATSFWTCQRLWEGRWILAAVVSVLPSALVTTLLLWRADLQRYRETPMGRYVVAHMVRPAVALRAAGQLLAWAGAAVQVAWLLPLGYAVIVFAWLRGLWRTARPAPSSGPQRAA